MKRRHRKARSHEPEPFAGFLRQLPPALRPLARRAQQAPSPCLLCQAPGTAIGAFVPLTPQAWGVAAGWQCGRVYTLCHPCLALPDAQRRVEAVLWQERASLARLAASPWN